jgi:DNA recombination protein RmuC
MTPLEIVFGALLLAAAALAAYFAWKASRPAPGGDAALGLMQQQLEGLRAQMGQSLDRLTGEMNRRLEDVSHRVADSQKAVGDRLDNAARVVGEVQKSLGTLGQASERIFEVGKDIAGLSEILRAPKMRGGLGEYFLGDLLGQILPAKHFSTQHSFKTGSIVDAVIRLGGKLVPVDSKFPLENFRRVAEAKSDEDRRVLRKKFVTDVKKHIGDIAAKYILPDEDTYDFALMYIPAENIYYEVIVKDESANGENSLTDFALKHRVIPVSPNSFYAYLQAVVLGLRGFEIEENARVIMQNLARLQGDFQRFREDFELVGKHLSNTRGKYEDAEKRLTRLTDKLGGISQAEGGAKALPEAASTPTDLLK